MNCNDAQGAAKSIQVHHKLSKRNDDARHGSQSAASSMHQIPEAHEIPGQRIRTTALHADGTAGPHAAAQAARVHATCRMMHQMQFFPFALR